MSSQELCLAFIKVSGQSEAVELPPFGQLRKNDSLGREPDRPLILLLDWYFNEILKRQMRIVGRENVY